MRRDKEEVRAAVEKIDALPPVDPHPDLAIMRASTIQRAGQIFKYPAGKVIRFADDPALYNELSLSLKEALQPASRVFICPNCNTAHV